MADGATEPDEEDAGLRGDRWRWLGLGTLATLAVVALLGMTIALVGIGTPAVTVDGFEGEATGDYKPIHAERADGGFAVEHRPDQAREGENLLAAWTGVNGDPTFLLSTDGLEAYPAPGDTFRCWLRSSDDPDSARDATQHNVCMFGVPSETEVAGYGVGLHERTDELRLYRYDAPKDRHVLDQHPVDVPPETWYRVEVDWGTEGAIEARYVSEDVEVGTLSATDETYTAQGVGFNVNAQQGGNNTVLYDGFTVDREPTGLLAVPPGLP